ncbi:MAG: response regulator [Chitinispirillaceae bacterium]
MSQKRILVVDDEVAILLAFKKLLKRPEVDVDTAESLEEAKELISQSTYNAVIVDLRLSGTLGQEGFEIIRTTKEYNSKAKVALITAYGSHGIEERARSLGADFYFEKPVSVRNLSLILESLGVK